MVKGYKPRHQKQGDDPSGDARYQGRRAETLDQQAAREIRELAARQRALDAYVREAT